jgi:signal transduction histidine kinase
LTGLLDLLLDFSRVEAGRLDLERRPLNLTPLIESLVGEAQATTERHKILYLGHDHIEGLWDEQRIEQVLRNLLTNAVKYSPGGGVVAVEMEASDAMVTVRVRDQGTGLPPDDLPHLFERFYRAEGTRRLEGAGLGLYICQAIVAAHGGRIWAESDGIGRGSTFSFTLPRA